MRRVGGFAALMKESVMAKSKTESKPKKMGRPSLGDSALRARIEVRCREDELQAWRAQAAIAAMDVGPWIREQLNAVSLEAARLLAKKARR